jgi:hypothetical protein
LRELQASITCEVEGQLLPSPTLLKQLGGGGDDAHNPSSQPPLHAAAAAAVAAAAEEYTGMLQAGDTGMLSTPSLLLSLSLSLSFSPCISEEREKAGRKNW